MDVVCDCPLIFTILIEWSHRIDVTDITTSRQSSLTQVLTSYYLLHPFPHQNVLYTLGQLAVEFPEVSDLLSQRLEEAELKMPPRPPSQTTARSRSGSGNAKVAGSNFFIFFYFRFWNSTYLFFDVVEQSLFWHRLIKSFILINFFALIFFLFPFLFFISNRAP